MAATPDPAATTDTTGIADEARARPIATVAARPDPAATTDATGIRVRTMAAVLAGIGDQG